MESAEKIKLAKGEWFNYYEMSIIMLIPTLGIAYFSFQDEDSSPLIYVALIHLAGSILFYWLSWKRLFFQEYKFEMTDEQFETAIKVTAKELDWRIVKLEKNYGEAFRSPEPLGAYGEKITIKKIENRILINSMRNPDLPKRGYSRKRNNENLNSFLINIANILKGKDVEKIVAKKLIKEEEKFWEESEWTIGNILMRIVGYGMTAIFFLMGIVFIYEGKWGGIFPICFGLGISLTYIKNDIRIVREKNRRKKLKKKKAVPNNA